MQWRGGTGARGTFPSQFFSNFSNSEGFREGFLSLFLAVGPAKGWQGWRWVLRGEGTPTIYLFFIFLVVGPTKRGGGLYSSFSSCGASLEMTGGVLVSLDGHTHQNNIFSFFFFDFPYFYPFTAVN